MVDPDTLIVNLHTYDILMERLDTKDFMEDMRYRILQLQKEPYIALYLIHKYPDSCIDIDTLHIVMNDD